MMAWQQWDICPIWVKLRGRKNDMNKMGQRFPQEGKKKYKPVYAHVHVCDLLGEKMQSWRRKLEHNQ